jgi:fructose-1,6-bisphosphatase I
MTIHDFFEAEYSDSVNQRNISAVLNAITKAAVSVSDDLKKAALLENVLGAQGGQNIQGEDQQKLDVIADLAFIEAFKSCGAVTGIGSEENEAFVSFDTETSKKADYVVLFDPLDGSSNIDVNVSVGTIFSIYKRLSMSGESTNLSDFLQPGSEQSIAGYVLYGTSTMLVLSWGAGVHGFTLNPDTNLFMLSHRDMKMPLSSRLYSMNEGNIKECEPGVAEYIAYCQSQENDFNGPYSGRYIGSLVADFHRSLIKGGIYIYPNVPAAPTGRLRLLYECNPLAFIAEQAGGMATTGRKRILEIEPKALHERAPLFIGSKSMVEKAMSFIS